MPLLDVSVLKPLAGPYELFDPVPAKPVVLRPLEWEQGSVLIHTAAVPGGKPVAVLRVRVPPADKVHVPAYWDITSKHLIAALLGYLEASGGRRYEFTVTKSGTGPTARYTVAAKPL
jgi:hypothetical protein